MHHGRTALVSEIVIGERQRKAFAEGALNELAASIKDKGLMHALVLRSVGDKLHLVAGERRLRSCTRLIDAGECIKYDGSVLEAGHVPFVLLTDLDELQQREAELEENLRRVDLTWQEEMQAMAQIHEMKVLRNPTQSVAQTGKEIAEKTEKSVSHTTAKLRQAQTISDHLDDPNVAKAKSADHAYRYILKNTERELTAALQKASVGIQRLHVLIKGDCREVMQQQAHTIGQCDLILTDPPYGMDAQNFGDVSNLAHDYEDTKENALEIAESIFVETFHRMTGERAHLYMFCDVDNFHELRKIAQLVGWKVQRTPLIWHKTGSQAHAPAKEYGHKRTYELILFAMKGDKPFSEVYNDVLSVPQVVTKDHAAQKPAELYAQLIRRSCLPGDRVFDPCCGSGTIFAAAEMSNTIGVGIEFSEKMFTVAELSWLATKGDKPVGGQPAQSEDVVSLGAF